MLLLLAQTILVLPFFNLSGSAELAWISESIAEMIRESIGASGSLAIEREHRDEAFRRLAVRPESG